MPKLLPKRVHPFCGIHLEGFALRLPFMEMIFMCIGSGCLVLGIAKNYNGWIEHRTTNLPLHYSRLMLWIGYAFHIVSTLLLAILLRKGVVSKTPALIRVWIVVTVLSVILAVGVTYTNLFMFGNFLPQILAIVTGYGFLKLYIVYAIYYYMKDMETDIVMASALRSLTDLEVAEFENGQELPAFGLDLKSKSLIDKVQYERYKREDFEISEHWLETDLENPLGKGEYGTVYKAVLKKSKTVHENSEYTPKETIVAVKTIDPILADVMCFKALLSELKVMTSMGNHKHVVQLIGANTQNIRKRNLLLVMEFCALGNMLTFLRGSRGLFRNLVNEKGQLDNQTSAKKSNYDTPLPESISTLDLIQWSLEIASGMEFLASRKVIHGDLAARNILLTDEKCVKITDFGLARQLYQYSVYIRRPNVLVPWRWLSIEALVDMNFSTSSDVWAFAITLWEIFSLGETPFPGYEFSLAFIDQLKQGLRPVPSLNTPDFIRDLMEQCWRPQPKTRPSFSDISYFIQSRHVNSPAIKP